MELNYYFGLLGVVLTLLAGMVLIYLGAMSRGLLGGAMIVVGLLLVGYGINQLISTLNTAGTQPVRSSYPQESIVPSFQALIVPKIALPPSLPG